VLLLVNSRDAPEKQKKNKIKIIVLTNFPKKNNDGGDDDDRAFVSN